MPPLAEDERGCSALISGGRVRARPQVGGRMRSPVERMLTRRLSTVDRRTFLRGLGPRIRAGMTTRHTNPTSTSSPARISSWLGSSYMARAPVLDPPRMHPPVDHQGTIVTDCCRICQVRLCSLTLTQLINVRGFSTTTPRSSRTFSHHRSSSISCPCPIASRTTSHHRSRVISHLYRLSSITSPRLAITHRRPSHSFIRVRHSLHPSRRSTTIRPTLRARATAPPDCSPTGTAATERSPSAPMRHIIRSPPSPSARGRPGLGSATCLL
ncbi:hypothetical protein PIB30_052729 [Stylosanthes scabra]|uniref:Uncharacterized protein n=1 Tax=Stylosanthes scabra TaxID=79078 RepID=A0ABU6SIU3_9FABA|nr:hypothetical protein [Stylosanthes scabra]